MTRFRRNIPNHNKNHYMSIALQIVSNPPQGIDLGFLMIRYYSLTWVVGFALGYYITKPIFNREGKTQEQLDSVFIWTAIGAFLGARLGQVFFYDWPYFQNHPMEILLPMKETQDGWKFTGFTGLASHGAAIAIILTMWYCSRKFLKKPLLWTLDRVVMGITLGGIFIRIGNFFNSEIYGRIIPDGGNKWYAMKFIREDEFWNKMGFGQQPMDITKAATESKAYDMIQHDPKFADVLAQIPYRHPAQLYEAFAYVFVLAILLFLYWKTDARKKTGYIFGVFLILLWSVRFVVEFVKASQGGFEGNIDAGALSTGQWLSIPFILAGIFLIIRAQLNSKKQPA